MNIIIHYYSNGYQLSSGEITFICVMTAVLAWFSYRLIKNYFRKKSTPLFFRYIVSGSAVLAVLTLFLPKVAEINKIPEVYTSPTFGLNSHNKNRIEVFGDKKAVDGKILLIGDSHALSIKPFLNYIGQKNHFSFPP